jgi:hypothetical protein
MSKLAPSSSNQAKLINFVWNNLTRNQAVELSEILANVAAEHKSLTTQKVANTISDAVRRMG